MLRRLAVATALLLACSSPASTAHEGVLAQAFTTSAANANVPRDLLVAIAQVEGGLDMPAHRTVHADAAVPAAGPLMLRHGKLDTLALGAALVKRAEIDLRQDSDLALEAGAHVLASLPHGDDLASWESALEEMSGYADADHRRAYAHRVFAALARGGSFAGRDGETIRLPAHDLPPSLVFTIDTRITPLAQAQYPSAEWIPTSCTNKCTPTRDGNQVQYVVIHDTEGGWDASVATLQNDSGKSVQYLVGVDGRVAQFVTEETTAWHAGNFHYNQRSVGIEHVGYHTKPYAEAQYAASAQLVTYLTAKYNVAKDRAHIIGHDQIPDGDKMAQSSPPCSDAPSKCVSSSKYGGANNHDDPGVWEWAGYMQRFGGEAKCNDVSTILTCSNDKALAFRCAAGKVEVRKCASACVPQKDGTDDICEVAPTSVPVSEPPADPPPTQETTGAEVSEEPAPDAPAASAEGGCSVTTNRGASAPLTSALASLTSLGIVLLFRRRKR